jgi:hypothetical protein
MYAENNDFLDRPDALMHTLFRGMFFGLPISIVLWVMIISAARLILF